MDKLSSMGPASRGQRYARIFRKAGTLLGKGDITRAAAILTEGRELAEALGDRAMARRFADEISRVTASGAS